MPLLNIVCPICTDVFKNSDDVYSTSCGHLFHFACMNDWQRRGTSCPQCRMYNPTSHKLYLSFDESDENLENQQEMELKLKTSNEKITQLLVQNSEIDTNFMKLQEQYTATEKAKRELEEKIRQMSDSEENFMHLQGQYTESSEHIKDLEDRINQLFIANECKTKELKLKILENESLKTGRNSNVTSFSDNILNERIRILEQKLENVTAELGKEISVSTKLSIEKMKLESYIKHLNTTDTKKPNTNKTQNSKQNRRNRKENIEKPNLSLTQQQEETSYNRKENRRNRKENIEKPNLSLSQQQEETSYNRKELSKSMHLQPQQQRNKSIIIKSIPRHLIIMPLELVVVNLASICKMKITADDIVKIYFLDNTGMDSPTSKLFVEFTSSNLKELFLAKKNLLSRCPFTASLQIREFMDETVLELYKYAKEKLKGNGFQCIYCANNKIFAKKNKECQKAIEVESKSHVNNLQVVRNVRDDIDENYYKIE